MHFHIDPDDGVTTPMPQSPMVLVKVTQPCLVSLLRTKLQKMLDIPPDHVRFVITSIYYTIKDNAPCTSFHFACRAYPWHECDGRHEDDGFQTPIIFCV